MAHYKGSPWAIVFTLAILVGGAYLTKVFLHREVPVNFGKKIEEFKSHGVPDFKLLPFISGGHASEPFHLYGSPEKVIIINFWATWCKPCVTEFPSLVALANLYQNDPRFKILAVAVNSSQKDIESFLSKAGVPTSTHFVILLDPDNTIAPIYGTEKIPETYIVNDKYFLLSKVIDQQNWVSPDFLTLLKRWL